MIRQEIIAPPKLNLFLHITGKRDDGYHLLDSLAVFPQNIGDVLNIEKAERLSFNVSGPFADNAGPDNNNLVLRAYHALPDDMQHPVRITLEKNTPAGAGLGGGSSDAAAMIHAMQILCEKELDPIARNQILLSLGADVPACYMQAPLRMQGIGEIITPLPPMPPAHIVLCWPGVSSYTKDVFGAWSKDFKLPLPAIPHFKNVDDLIGFLKTTDNVLSTPAIETCPPIGAALYQMSSQGGCLLSRMTGSGSCVFGIFDHEESAAHAAKTLSSSNPRWWIRASTI